MQRRASGWSCAGHERCLQAGEGPGPYGQRRERAARAGLHIELIDADGNLFFIEVKGRVDGADSVIPWEQVRGQLGLG